MKQFFKSLLLSVVLATAQVAIPITSVTVTTVLTATDATAQYHSTLFYQKNTAFTTEYQAVLDKGTALGYILPNQYTQVAQNDLILYLKRNGLWTSTWDIFHVGLTNDATLANFSTINWADPNNYQCTLSGTAPTYGAFGWTGGSNKFLNTNWNPSTNGVNFTTNSATVIASVIESSANTGGILGVNNSSLGNRITIEPRYTDNNAYLILNGASTGIYTATFPDMAGLWMCTRTASNAAAFYKDGQVLITQTGSATGRANNNLYYLAENNNGTAANFNSNTIALGAAGRGLTAAEANLFTIGWRAYVSAILQGTGASIVFPTATTNSDFTAYNNARTQQASRINQPLTYNTMGAALMQGFIGGVMIQGRYLYCIPYTPGTATRFLKIDTFTGAQTLFGPTLTVAGWTGGCAFGPNDRYIFCNAHNATVVAIIDTIDDSVTFWDTTGQVAGESGNLTGTTKWDCPVISKNRDKIVVGPHTDNRVFIFNTSTYGISFVTTDCVAAAYIGGTALPNEDKIIFSPWNETRALVFDVTNNTADLTTYTGFPSSTKKWAGAYVVSDGTVHFFPQSYNKVGGVNPYTHTKLTEYGSFTAGTDYWIGAKVMADGNIYGFSASTANDYLLKVDPINRTTTSISGPIKAQVGTQINAYGQLWGVPTASANIGWFGYKLPIQFDYNWVQSVYSNKF